MECDDDDKKEDHVRNHRVLLVAVDCGDAGEQVASSWLIQLSFVESAMRRIKVCFVNDCWYYSDSDSDDEEVVSLLVTAEKMNFAFPVEDVIDLADEDVSCDYYYADEWKLLEMRSPSWTVETFDDDDDDYVSDDYDDDQKTQIHKRLRVVECRQAQCHLRYQLRENDHVDEDDDERHLSILCDCYCCYSDEDDFEELVWVERRDWKCEVEQVWLMNYSSPYSKKDSLLKTVVVV